MGQYDFNLEQNKIDGWAIKSLKHNVLEQGAVYIFIPASAKILNVKRKGKRVLCPRNTMQPFNVKSSFYLTVKVVQHYVGGLVISIKE